MKSAIFDIYEVKMRIFLPPSGASDSAPSPAAGKEGVRWGVWDRVCALFFLGIHRHGTETNQRLACGLVP